MTFANPIPSWALAVLLISAAALAWLAYRRTPLTPAQRTGLGAIRFLTFATLLVLLMRPIARAGSADAKDAIVPILVDTSRSMGIEDADGIRRIDRARRILTEDVLPALASRFQTEVLAFGEALAPASPETLGASGRRSDLTAAITAAAERYRGRTVAGIVVLSDGGDTSAADGIDAKRAAGRAPKVAAETAVAAPVFAIGVGSRTIQRDREVLSVTAAEAVLDDSRIDLAVSAVSHGHGTAPIELRLLESGRPIDVRRATPAADGVPVREVFHVAPRKGVATVFTVEIPAAAGELVPENNTRSVLVQSPARPRRVLLVQGAPGFEHSFLRRAWSGDTGLDVDAVVRKGKNEQGADTFYVQAEPARGPLLTAGYPTTTASLFAYDAIVLANMEGALLTRAQLDMTREFVGRRGGGVLVLGAQSFVRRGLVDTPLEEILPLDLGERGGASVVPAANAPPGANRVALTTDGEVHPIMQLTAQLDATRKRWGEVPALASIVPLGGPRPGATVLAVTSGPGGNRALVAVQRYGEGRSMVFTGEAAWRWRMLMPASDRSYDTFWRQAVRWLAAPAADPVAVFAPAGAAAGDVVPLRIAVRDASFQPLPGATVDVRVTRPDGRAEPVSATADAASPDGAFVAKYRAEDPGVYRVTADVRRPDAPAVTAAVSLLVGGADPEMSDPRVNMHVLQRIAAASGGRVIEPADAASAVRAIYDELPAAALLVRRDAWHSGWAFTAIVVLLAAEWILRRRWGLR